MKRTSVYAEAADLAVITEAARKRGVPAAELLREGIRLAAMANRVWDEPLDWPTFDISPVSGSAGER
ncbi:CopG family transcriptional regulator [Kribbella antibiotica]|nr:CopG family transcriptional regulator [Kribbella antibiotica]